MSMPPGIMDNPLAAVGTSRCLFGENRQIKQICEIVRKVARSTGPVLIRGESGTGKEILAQAIHLQGPRAGKPFIAVNAAAIPRELFESELFGHQKGSFTGADRDRTGRFDEADGGTLFLDEIGDMAPEHQVKLLRVLQTGEVQPVGAARSHRVETRVVAATNQDLETLVEEGRFREDLYFRINLFPLTIPPLRDRREDILPLARHFAAGFARQQGWEGEVRLAPEVETLLTAYSWPGNIRELENCLHFAVTMMDGGTVGLGDLPDHVRLCQAPFAVKGGGPSAGSGGSLPREAGEVRSLAEVERAYVLAAYAALERNKTQTAKRLGISLRSLQMKLKEWGES